MPSDIDIYQPNVEPPRADEPAHAEAGQGRDTEPGPEPASEPRRWWTSSPRSADDHPPESPPTPPAAEPPPPFINSSTSGDDLTVSLTQARPDPLLDKFVTEDSPDALTPPPAAPPPEAETKEPALHGGSRADALNELAALDMGGAAPSVGPGASASFDDALGGIDLNVPREDRAPVKKVSEEEEEDEEDDEVPPRGVPLGTMLLASYASAVTIGLIWVLWTGRRLHESEEADAPVAAESREDPGARAGDSRRIAPPKPIPAEHLATLGKTVRLGQIEATPLAVTSGPVVLERTFDRKDRKPGGDNALKLRLRLKNVSKDAVIAPLDEAFLRDRPRADPDSFIETPAGGPPVAQFPLAVESEWSIVGQEFRDLKPGEVLETVVVSAPDALARKSPEMTWRVRLRTDLNHTDDLGVRFGEKDIKPGP